MTTAMPKSGSLRITATKTPITTSTGRKAFSPSLGFSPFRSIAQAAKAMRMNLASSEGWKVNTRRLIQRDAPFAVCRTPGTKTRRRSPSVPITMNQIRRR